MAQGVDFTKGKIYKPLIKFAFPIFMANLLQNTYGAVDMLIIGMFCDSKDVSAVANGAQVMFTVSMLVMGLSVGVSILLGQKMGAKEEEEGGKVVGASISLFLLLSLLVSAILTIFSSQIVSLLNTPLEAKDICIDYILICGLAFVFFVSYNLFGAIFRAIGDSKTPLITVAIACCINIILDLLFIAVFDFGVQGAAVATVISQALSVYFSLLYIRKKELPFSFSLNFISIHKEYYKKILYFGAPLAAQFVLAQISFLMITSIVNSFGLIASAGLGIAQRIISFIMLVPSSLAQATASITAQNYGAKNIDRAVKSLNYALATSFGISVFIAYYCFFYGYSLAALFTKDAEVIIASWQYMKGYSLDVLLTAFFFLYTGFFNGCGKTKVVMYIGVFAAFAIRVPLSYVFSYLENTNLFIISLATPISSVIQTALYIFFYYRLVRELRKRFSN